MTGIGIIGALGFCGDVFWHSGQDLQYSATSLVMPGHQNRLRIHVCVGLIYGCDVTGPLDILREEWLPSQQDSSDIATYVTQLHEKMQEAKDIVHKHLQQA